MTLLRRTNVARAVAWHLHAELLEPPYSDDRHVVAGDALAESILADPDLNVAHHARLPAIAERGGGRHWRMRWRNSPERRPHRMLGAMQRPLMQPDARGFVARDHAIARLPDLFDLVGAAGPLAMR